MFYTSMTPDLIRLMLEVTWFNFLGMFTSLLEGHEDLDIVPLCLDGLRYAISATLFLDMDTEKRAFSTLLAKYNFLVRILSLTPTPFFLI